MTIARVEPMPATSPSWMTAASHFAVSHPRSWMLGVVLVAIALSLFSRFPAYTDIHARFPGNFVGFTATVPGRAIQWWLNHPFQSVPVETLFSPEATRDPMIAGAASHCDKLTYRAFLPLLNQLTGAGVWTLIIANHIATVITFLLGYRMCLRATRDPLSAAFIVWAYAASWAGSWGFNDLMFGDAVAIALLLVTAFVRQGWLVSLIAIAAGLTDERAFTAAPLVALYRYWIGIPSDGFMRGYFRPKELWIAGGPYLVGALCYVGLRLYAALALKLHSGTTMMGTSEIVLYHFYVSYPGKLFKVFEFLWFFPLAFLARLFSAPAARRDGLVFLLCLACAATPALLIWDVDRSLCYLFPGILVAVCFLPSEAGRKRRLALLACAACLAWVEPNVSALRYFVFD